MTRERSNSAQFAVLLVVDHEPLAAVLQQHLQESERISDVTAIASTGDVLHAIDAVAAAVVLVDDQTEADSVEICRSISQEWPVVHCVILGTALNPGDKEAALESGAAAYAVKSLSGESVRDTVHAVFDGREREQSRAEPFNCAC